MNREGQERFDRLLQEVIDDLPAAVLAMIEEVPVVVLDLPTAEMLRDVGMDPADAEAAKELCGLHSGTMNTEKSVEQSAELPNSIHLFREGIVDLAGGWDDPEADDLVYEEIRTTLLHEIGHEFGLDEDDLERLGYD